MAIANEGGTDASTDAGRDDAGWAPCYPLESPCDPAPIPLEALWSGYWEADVGVETEPTAGPDGPYPGVMRWRSRVGDATLAFPANPASTFGQETRELTAPRFALDGWCPDAACLPSVRFRHPPGTDEDVIAGQVLVSTDAELLSLVSAESRTLTAVMQVELEPDPDLRASTLFSFGPISWTFPFMRGYASGTLFRGQAQLTEGGAHHLVDFNTTVVREAPLFVAYVIDLDDPAHVVALYVATHGEAPALAGTVGESSMVLPVGAGKMVLGGLGHGVVRHPFDGQIRRFGLSSEALSMAQLQEIATAWQTADASFGGGASTTSSLGPRWPMGESGS